MANNLSATQLEILDGHMLGDGNLSLSSKFANPRLRINRAGIDHSFNQWTAAHFSDFLSEKSLSLYEVHDSRRGRTYQRSTLTTRRSKAFLPAYERWYSVGNKNVPKDIALTSLLVATWFADDGSLVLKKCGGVDIKFNTSSFSELDVDFLVEKLNARYGNTFTKGVNGNPTDVPQYVIWGASRAARQVVADIAPVFDMLPRKRAIWENAPTKFSAPLPNCPFCQQDSIYLNGLYRGRGTVPLYQKYKCRQCGHAFKGELLSQPITPKNMRIRS